jgi:oxygen-independent coproporphyrinogen-3 oxidase
MKPVHSLYVHVPFCARKCDYCAFYSEVGSGDLIDRYVQALERELERVAPHLQSRTVFFGGGTPSVLNLGQWTRVLRALGRLGLLGAEEWTIECNPATVSADKARLLRDHGVNRISLGVQSLDERLLDRLGRVHSRDMVFRSFDLLRKAGFDNVNLDLMFAIPGQTLAVWEATLREALAMGSEHLSCYEVIYEEDTPLFHQLQAGQCDVDEDLACAMYEALQETAEGAGFAQYEVANFARVRRNVGVGEEGDAGRMPGHLSSPPSPHSAIPAFACRHNVNYWRGGSFYGLGPSATSYVGGVRWKNCANTQRYCQGLETGGSTMEFREALPAVSRAGETAAFGLRMVAGWGFEEFKRISGADLREEWSAEMEALCERGWGERMPDRFKLTRKGLRFADAAAEMFLR